MKTRFYILLDTLPEYTDELGNVRQNVIHRIWWTENPVDPEEGVLEAAGHVNIDISDLSDYIEIEMITETELEAWALANINDSAQ